MKLKLVLQTWFSKQTSQNCYANFLDCLDQVFVYDSCKSQGWFFGH